MVARWCELLVKRPPAAACLAVHSDHPRVFQKLWAMPGVMRHQSGDAEMRTVFAVKPVGNVATVIRAER